MIVVIDNTVLHTSICKPFLLAYLKANKQDYITVRTKSRLVSVCRDNDVTGFILTGSSQHLRNIDVDKYEMNAMAVDSGLPVLGICFGSQFINAYFGGKIRYSGPLKNLIKDVTILKNDKTFKANFLASYYIHTLADVCVPLYVETKSKRVVFFKHGSNKMKIYGVLFHPESNLVETHFVLDDFIGKCC